MTVFLVGAGPGSADLLTVKAYRLISSAQVLTTASDCPSNISLTHCCVVKDNCLCAISPTVLCPILPQAITSPKELRSNIDIINSSFFIVTFL